MAHLGLPPNILAMFNPRPPLEYWPPAKKGKFPAYTGVAQFVNLFEDPATAPPPPAWRPPESRRKREERLKREKQEKHEQELRKALEEWDPHKDPNVEGDPKATLFVARINYETTEAKLRREFEQFGPIKRIRIVTDKTTGKPRGYAFIEFESPNDMKNAYKYADGRKIDGRRVVVDYERGRTVRNWRPRRLGGGLGNTRAGGPPGGGGGGAGGGPSSTPYYGDDRSRGDSGRDYHDRGGYRGDERGGYRGDRDYGGSRRYDDRRDYDRRGGGGGGGGYDDRRGGSYRGGDRGDRDSRDHRGGGGGGDRSRDYYRDNRDYRDRDYRGGGGGGDGGDYRDRDYRGGGGGDGSDDRRSRKRERD